MPAGTSAVGGDSIASVALSYQGKPYKWGGYLPSGWDCSGFVNYVLGNNFGITLPGGYRYSGKAHGPVTGQYLVWTGASSVKEPVAGDLCCWPTHIGIAISSTQMVSALDPKYGTRLSPFSWGPAGEPLTFRRISGATLSGANAGSSAGINLAGCLPGMIALPVLIPMAAFRRHRAAKAEAN